MSLEPCPAAVQEPCRSHAGARPEPAQGHVPEAAQSISISLENGHCSASEAVAVLGQRGGKGSAGKRSSALIRVKESG